MRETCCGQCGTVRESSDEAVYYLRAVLGRKLDAEQLAQLEDAEVVLCDPCLEAHRARQREDDKALWERDRALGAVVAYEGWCEAYAKGTEKERPTPPDGFFSPDTMRTHAPRINLAVRRMKQARAGGDL